MARVDVTVIGAGETPFHHSSHRRLLEEVVPSGVQSAHVDAVIVPTARPTHWLREAAGLAKQLGSVLVALCSKRASASEAAALGDDLGVRTLAIDMPGSVAALPPLRSGHIVSRPEFKRSSDTSVKRNLALILCRMVGWDRVLFLDDDIYDVDSGDVRAAAGLLSTNFNDAGYFAVGLKNVGYPDNSVVCHVHRETGGRQEQLIGAGALIVSPTRSRTFFPDVYNQDWLFLLGQAQRPWASMPSQRTLNLLPAVAVMGSMRQKNYDPFADSDRARREEFGDCVAEGLYWLLDLMSPPANVSMSHLPHFDRTQHWGGFLHRRMKFIDELLEKARDYERKGRAENTAAWLKSLDVALSTTAHMTPELCTAFVRAWLEDLGAWRELIGRMPTRLSVQYALCHLALEDRSIYVSMRPFR